MSMQKYRVTLPDEYLPSSSVVNAQLKGGRMMIRFNREKGEVSVERDMEEQDARAFADSGLMVERLEPMLSEKTVAELREMAADLGISGRSGMDKEELVAAIENEQKED